MPKRSIPSPASQPPVLAQLIERAFRGQKVMLEADLAHLYHVSTNAFN